MTENRNIADWSIGQITNQISGSTDVLFENKIDFVANRQKSLKEVMIRQNLNHQQIIEKLTALKQTATQNAEKNPDCEKLDNTSLVRHIETRYHAVHRIQLSELIPLADRVEKVHQDSPLCPTGLAQQLDQIQIELLQHMQKEEMVLFPMLCADVAPMVHGPISMMRHEHEEHFAQIENIYQITHALTLPEKACGNWRALYQGLKEFISDINMHIHLENNVLFERAQNL